MSAIIEILFHWPSSLKLKDVPEFTKTHVRASIFSKFPGGAHPQTSQSGLLTRLLLLTGWSSPTCLNPHFSNPESTTAMVARHTFLVKPLSPVYTMFGGVPAKHKDFWKSVTVVHLMDVYLASSATAHNVLKVLKEPEVLQPLQETTYSCLLMFVGNMRNQKFNTSYNNMPLAVLPS